MQSKHSKKNKSNKRNILINNMFVKTIVLVIIIILISIGFKNFKKNQIDELQGTWTTDGVTIYEFDGKGEGNLKLPASEYKFIYSIDGNNVHIDFENEKATDSDYSFVFEGNNMILNGINQTTGTYTFKRQEETN